MIGWRAALWAAVEGDDDPNLRNAKDGGSDPAEGAKHPSGEGEVRRQASGKVGTEASLREGGIVAVCTRLVGECIREEVV